MVVSVLVLFGASAQAQRTDDALGVTFDEKRGQVEVGGSYAGVEFHDSRPVPARISFYYPVANSIDLSTDYWKRGTSRPLDVTIRVDGRADSLWDESWAYEWTPFRVAFHAQKPAYDATLSYHFAADLPIVVLKLTVHNRTMRRVPFGVDTRLRTSLRTSHAYVSREPDRTGYTDDGAAFVAAFDAADTDSAAVFVTNVGVSPTRHGEATMDEPEAAFSYEQVLEPGDSLVVVQLIGTSRQSESASVRRRAVATWPRGVADYEQSIGTYVREQSHFAVRDSVLMETYLLAKSLLKANRHYIDGRIVPMPSPAEYNFFFTHDLLLTDLGAVFFDTERVRDDLRFVQSLVRADSVLPHAYYWREDRFVTELANADNWNHLWFILLAASYLKHSDDTATVAALYPVLQKSLALMLGNERDGLMVAERPDWWDIGHVPGPRAYLTVLMIRALRGYAFISIELGKEDPGLASYLTLAERMNRALVDRLWDADAGYLLNGLDTTTVDRHYYTGPLLAVAYGMLSPEQQATMLATARRELLDERVGVRNAMPADFHELRDVYHFLEGEVGAPYLYMNGGVWPQGIAWYALALLGAERPDEARSVLTDYLSIGGIRHSPNGQPAFFEYRNADPASPAYGAVDKPTFLWAGGWYLHVLYQLAGVRETPWNLSFSPNLPEGFSDVAYDLTMGGELGRVSWTGSGLYFRRIVVDGAVEPSAVLTGSAARVELERGRPTAPYLAAASCIVERVRLEGDTLVMAVRGVAGQQVELDVVAPAALSDIRVNGTPLSSTAVTTMDDEQATVTRIRWTLQATTAEVTIRP
jgi:glycogen debranching enzyme